jgi:hypothetical protein
LMNRILIFLSYFLFLLHLIFYLLTHKKYSSEWIILYKYLVMNFGNVSIYALIKKLIEGIHENIELWEFD